MISLYRSVACLALSGCALLPVVTAHAAPPTPAALRYQYAAGQRYAYKLSVNARASVAGTGAAAAGRSTSSTTGVIRYHILSFDLKRAEAKADVTTSGLRVRELCP